MSLVALDSCRRQTLCALVATDDGDFIEGATFEGSLAQSIPQALSQYLTDDLEGVVVVRGPGSYTGIRAGIAAAKALVGTRGAKLYATDRLTALAAVHGSGASVCLLEAGRDGVYTQTFGEGDPPRPTSQPGHHTIGEWTPPNDHEIVSDFAFPNARICAPLEILAAATRVALSAGAVELSRIDALYVSQPEFIRTT